MRFNCGVDDEDILCELALPTLSSIALDLDSIGYQAASLLDRLMGPEERARRRRAALHIGPREIVERDSTRVFICEDALVEQAVSLIRSRCVPQGSAAAMRLRGSDGHRARCHPPLLADQGNGPSAEL